MRTAQDILTIYRITQKMAPDRNPGQYIGLLIENMVFNLKLDGKEPTEEILQEYLQSEAEFCLQCEAKDIKSA